MVKSSELQLSALGPLSRTANAMMRVARLTSPMRLVGKYVKVLKPRGEVTELEAADSDFTTRRARAVEWYVLSCVAIEGAIVVGLLVFAEIPLGIRICLYGLTAARIIDIVQTVFAVTIFDRLPGRTDDSIASAPRMVLLAFVNFTELTLCFGTVYALDYHRLKGAGQVATAYYFSLVTQLTIGYGDVFPTGYLRVVAALHGAVALVFFTLVFARLLTALPEITPFGRASKK